MVKFSNHFRFEASRVICREGQTTECMYMILVGVGKKIRVLKRYDESIYPKNDIMSKSRIMNTVLKIDNVICLYSLHLSLIVFLLSTTKNVTFDIETRMHTDETVSKFTLFYRFDSIVLSL